MAHRKGSPAQNSSPTTTSTWEAVTKNQQLIRLNSTRRHYRWPRWLFIKFVMLQPSARTTAGGLQAVIRLQNIGALPREGRRRQRQQHFQWLIWQASCYTLLSGCRLLWPPSCRLYQPTPFMRTGERRVWCLNQAFGSSRSASSTYQKWPTGCLHSSPSPCRAALASYPLKVEELVQAVLALMPFIIRFTG